MIKNHKNLENSAFYGLNIVQISIYFSTLITISIQLLIYLETYWNQYFPINMLTNLTTLATINLDLALRSSAYVNSLMNIQDGPIIMSSLGLALITIFAPIFFIFYGLVFYLRHRKYKVQSESQQRLFKIISILVSLNLIIIFGIILFNSINKNGQFHKAIDKGDVSACEKLFNQDLREKCVSEYVLDKPYFHECNSISDTMSLYDYCIEEVSKISNDWKGCYELNENQRVKECINDIAIRNNYFLDTEVCDAMAPDEDDIYFRMGETIACYAKIAYIKKDHSLCNELKGYDARACYDEYLSLWEDDNL